MHTHTEKSNLPYNNSNPYNVREDVSHHVEVLQSVAVETFQYEDL